MRSIDLLPNEGVIAQFDNVGCESPDFKGFERGELTLTNMSLVFTYTRSRCSAKTSTTRSRGHFVTSKW